MARNLHDSIGHTFTSLIIGMDGVKALLEVSPQDALAKLDHLRNFANENLQKVRTQIHEMAPQDAEITTISKSFQDIVKDFKEHTDTKVTLSLEGEEPDTPQTLRFQLINCLQESLTNAKRHGQATSVTVHLAFDPDSIQLAISDNGTGDENIKLGFGLTHMKERITNHNGTFNVTSHPKTGTTIKCTIPI